MHASSFYFTNSFHPLCSFHEDSYNSWLKQESSADIISFVVTAFIILFIVLVMAEPPPRAT